MIFLLGSIQFEDTCFECNDSLSRLCYQSTKKGKRKMTPIGRAKAATRRGGSNWNRSAPVYQWLGFVSLMAERNHISCCGSRFFLFLVFFSLAAQPQMWYITLFIVSCKWSFCGNAKYGHPHSQSKSMTETTTATSELDPKRTETVSRSDNITVRCCPENPWGVRGCTDTRRWSRRTQ